MCPLSIQPSIHPSFSSSTEWYDCNFVICTSLWRFVWNFNPPFETQPSPAINSIGLKIQYLLGCHCHCHCCRCRRLCHWRLLNKNNYHVPIRDHQKTCATSRYVDGGGDTETATAITSSSPTKAKRWDTKSDYKIKNPAAPPSPPPVTPFSISSIW